LKPGRTGLSFAVREDYAMKKALIALAIAGMTFGLTACETWHHIFG
jgi:hypothetical protein